MTFFGLLKSAKIDFTKNQRGRKIAKFSHCVVLALKGEGVEPNQLSWSDIQMEHSVKTCMKVNSQKRIKAQLLNFSPSISKVEMED